MTEIYISIIAIFLLSTMFLLFVISGLLLLLFLIFKRDKELLEQNKELNKLNSEMQTTKTKLQEENYDLLTLNNQYSKFIVDVYDVLSEDVDFLKGELTQKLSLEIPEVRSLYNGLVSLVENINSIKVIVEESERIKNE